MMKHLRPDGYYTEKVLRTFEVVGVCEANTGVFRQNLMIPFNGIYPDADSGTQTSRFRSYSSDP